MRTGPQENFVGNFEVDEWEKYNTLKQEDEQNGSKEYIECKKEGQNYNYDITGENTVPECLKFENKSEPKNHMEARLKVNV